MAERGFPVISISEKGRGGLEGRKADLSVLLGEERRGGKSLE